MSFKKLRLTTPHGWEPRDWGKLMSHPRAVLDKVIKRWEALLQNDQTTERDCLQVIALFIGLMRAF